MGAKVHRHGQPQGRQGAQALALPEEILVVVGGRLREPRGAPEDGAEVMHVVANVRAAVGLDPDVARVDGA